MSDTTVSTREAARLAAARIERSAAPGITRDRRRDVARPPGPPAVAALSRMLGRSGGAAEFLVEIERGYPDLAHTRLAGEHAYFVNRPDLVIDVMLTSAPSLMKGRGLQAAKALLGNGLLTSEGADHLRQRRLVQPAFHRDRIAAYAGLMVERARRHCATWQDAARIDLTADMSALTLAIVGDTLFGVDLTGDAAEVGAALNDMLEGAGTRLLLGPQAFRIPTPSRRRALESAVRLDSIVLRMIDEHRRAGDTGDMLSMLIAAQEDGHGMSDEQLRDEAMTLVLAGHETTAMALSWTWLLLAENPSVLRWWHEEIDALPGDPAYADLAGLHRTRAILAESLRLRPPAWIIGRRALADLDVGGWVIPSGAVVIASPYALHRSPRWWRSSLSFRPERWLVDGAFDEAAPGQPRGAWFPFGFGNRRCIGDQFALTEGTLVLATLGRQWHVQPDAGHPVRPNPAVTLRPAGRVPATVSRRSRGA